MNLIVDVGTNAEIVLGNRERLLAASSPTGPAFEGAQISCGQRAAPGAIERVRIDPDTLEPRFRVIGCDAWSDDPAFAGTHVTGVCGSGIIEAIAELHLAGVITTDGTIDGALAARTPRIVADGRTFSYVLFDGEPELTITQNDVRQIQLAKAALHAGCRCCSTATGSSASTGSASPAPSAATSTPCTRSSSGSFPTATRAGVTSAGNAAGTGARIALLDRSARAEIEDVVRRVEKIETAVEPRFQEHFVAGDGDPARHRPIRAAARRRHPAAAPRRDGRAAGARRRRRRTDPPRGDPHDRDGTRPPLRRPRRAPGGARSSTPSSVPFITRTLTPVRGALRGGPGADRGERRHDPRAGRDRVPRHAGGARAVPRAGRGRRRRARALPARPLPASSCRRRRPPTFTQVARNPEHNVEIGGTNTVFAPAYGSPFVRDLDGGRRYGTIEDFRNFVKLDLH